MRNGNCFTEMLERGLRNRKKHCYPSKIEKTTKNNLIIFTTAYNILSAIGFYTPYIYIFSLENIFLIKSLFILTFSMQVYLDLCSFYTYKYECIALQ